MRGSAPSPRIFLTVFGAILCFSSISHAQRSLRDYGFAHTPYPPEIAQQYREHLKEYQSSLGKLHWFSLPVMEHNARLKPRGSAHQMQTEACRRYYKNLYNGESILIRAVYGYFDAFVSDKGKLRAYVGDKTESELLRERFLAPCPNAGSFACGFSGGLPGDSTMTKTIKGPDGRSRTIALELFSSAHSQIEKENRDARDLNRPSSAQLNRSLFVENKWLSGFAEADVLIYIGHARDGGGPSFEPPLLHSGRSVDPVDFSYYRRHRPGFLKMVNALAATTRPPKVISLFACKSVSHFSENRNNLANTMSEWLRHHDITFIGTSGLTSSNTDLANFVGLIDNIAGLRCGDGFKNAVSLKTPGNEIVITGPTP